MPWILGILLLGVTLDSLWVSWISQTLPSASPTWVGLDACMDSASPDSLPCRSLLGAWIPLDYTDSSSYNLLWVLACCRFSLPTAWVQISRIPWNFTWVPPVPRFL